MPSVLMNTDPETGDRTLFDISHISAVMERPNEKGRVDIHLLGGQTISLWLKPDVLRSVIDRVDEVKTYEEARIRSAFSPPKEDWEG